MERRTRRDVLGTLVGGVAATLAGCSGGEGPTTYVTENETPSRTTMAATGELPVEGEVRRYRYDDRNSGVADAEAPGPEFDRAWTYETYAKAVTTPAVANGLAYIGDLAGSLHAVGLETGAEYWVTDVAPGPVKGIKGSPTVVDGQVFLGSASDLDTNDARVVAVDSETGEENWQHVVGRFARAAPTVVDGHVYAASADGVYCLDAEAGEEEWVFETGGLDDAPPVNEVVGSVPVVDGLVVAATRAGAVYGVDAETGERRWTTDANQEVLGAPAVADGTVFVGSFDDHVYAFDLETGAEEWRYDTGGWTSTAVVATDDVVYVGNKDGDVTALTTDGTEVWTRSVRGIVTGAPVLAGDAVLVGTREPGGVSALDAETGEPRWRYRTAGTVNTPVTALDSAVLVPTLANRVHAIYD